jgi:hypothetical protein
LNVEKRKFQQFQRRVASFSEDPEVQASLFMDSRFWPPRRGRVTPLDRVAEALCKNGFVHCAELPDLRGKVKERSTKKGRA